MEKDISGAISSRKSLTQHDLMSSNSRHSDVLSVSVAEDATMEDVARIMREEDAHLLESLHFDTNVVDTPVLSAIEGNPDDVPPLIYEVKVGETLSGQKAPKVDMKRSVSLGDDTGPGISTTLGRRFSHSQGGDDVIFRQCLSGEIKSFPATVTILGDTKISPVINVAINVAESNDDEATPGGEETTTSSTCCSHEASISPMKMPRTPTERKGTSNALDEKRRSISNDRRMNEAVQFVEAVGEIPPLDKNEQLLVIDEDDLDDTDDEDENNDGNGTVIRLDELESQVGSIQEYQLEGDVGQDVGASTSRTVTTSDGQQDNDIPREIIRRKSRPQWPLRLPGWTFSHLDTSTHTTLENTVQDFVYRGIHSNPPEIVKRGMSRGNHVQLHRKAWLEVSDKYHRYGKNLRLYYRHWESLDYPTNMFFDWLDSKGEAAGQPLPNLEECPRSKLDSDTVLYINNPEVTAGYSLKIVTDTSGRATFIDVDGELVKTGSDGWIFVLRDGLFYGAEKITSISGQSKQRFHHSSFFGGKAVAAAGIFITDDDGFLTRLYPHSGHYRPREAHMQRLLYFLYHQGVDLRTFEMDTQQIMHVARDIIDGKKTEKSNKKAKDEKHGNNSENPKKEGEKKKKIESLLLLPAVHVAYYVAHKAHCIGEGVFAQIHQIRNANVTSVSEALNHLKGKKRISARKQAMHDCEQLP
jgi:hypothetical protein